MMKNLGNPCVRQQPQVNSYANDKGRIPLKPGPLKSALPTPPVLTLALAPTPSQTASPSRAPSASPLFFILLSIGLMSFLFCGFFLLADEAQAHGGFYRGPGQPLSPSPGPLGGVTPGGAAGVTPRAATAGGATPRVGRGTRSAAAPLWELWWAYNREPYLKLKNRIHRAQPTESGGYALGESDQPIEIVRPDNQVIRQKIVPTLRRAMSDHYYDVRAAAVIGLGKVGEESDRTLIEKGLRDPDRRVVESAALALGILGSPESIDPLADLLLERGPARQLLGRSRLQTRTRAFAAIGLGLIGRRHPELHESITPSLLLAARMTREARKDISVCAMTALGIMGAKVATPVLIGILKDPKQDDVIRAQAVIALGKIGDAIHLPLVEKALRDPTNPVRRSAAVALGLLAKPTDQRAVASLGDLVEKGNDPIARSWALISLGKIGGDRSRDALRRAFEEERQSIQAFAALGLALWARNSGDFQDAKTIRASFLSMKGDSVPGALAISLGLMGYRKAEDDLLRALVRKGDPDLKGYCAVALGLMDSRAAVPIINRLLRSRVDPDFQRSAATALGLMGDAKVVDALNKILNESRTEYTTSSAARALGFVGDVAAVDPLIRTIWDERRIADLARAQATSALGIVGDDSPLPPFHIIAVDNNYRAFVEALQEIVTFL